MDVKEELEVLPASVFPMVVGGGVGELVVRREPKARPYSARPMGVAGVANILGAQRVLKAVQTTALAMAEVGGAVARVVPWLQEGNLACASDMGVARGVRWKIAPRVLRAFMVSASLMVVVVVANILPVQKVQFSLPEGKSARREPNGNAKRQYRVQSKL